MTDTVLEKSEFGDLYAEVVFCDNTRFQSYNVRLCKKVLYTDFEQKWYSTPYRFETILVRSFGNFERAEKVYQELTRNKTITILKYS